MSKTLSGPKARGVTRSNMSYTLCIKHSDKLMMYSQFQTKKQGSGFQHFTNSDKDKKITELK